MPAIGVVGTMVWDRIFAWDGGDAPVEGWGGISYALAAAAGAAPDGWEVVPIVKVGRDLADAAWRFLEELPRTDPWSGIRVDDRPNNRVELRYHDPAHRTERLTGGVAPWSMGELAPLVSGLDALYINFISGLEMELETAERLRRSFSGPVYADLHSLFLDLRADGRRRRRPLPEWRRWLGCFDAVQVNEEELDTLAPRGHDPWRFAARVVGRTPQLLLVTLGGRGAAFVAAPSFVDDPATWPATRGGSEPHGQAGPVRSECVPLGTGARDGDPTGCGDVWGATCFSRLLAGAPLDAAVRAANEAAAWNVAYRGAAGLHRFLQERIHA